MTKNKAIQPVFNKWCIQAALILSIFNMIVVDKTLSTSHQYIFLIRPGQIKKILLLQFLEKV
jgi:hypothetical protein